MLNQQTLEKLHGLRLHGMAEAFRAQSEQTGITELSFEERFVPAIVADDHVSFAPEELACRHRQNHLSRISKESGTGSQRPHVILNVFDDVE